MRLVRNLLYALAVATILACGGVGGGITEHDTPGIAFTVGNPQGVLANSTVDLLVVTSPLNTDENGHAFTAHTTVPAGVTVDNGTWSGTIGSATRYHVITLHIPDGLAEGTHLNVGVSRTSETSPFGIGLSTSHELVIGSSTVIGGFQGQGAVTGAPGATVTGNLTLTSLGSASGLVEFLHEVSGVSVNPTSLTITANGTANATVSYSIPSGAAPGSMIDVPVFFTARTNDGFALMHVQVSGGNQGDFGISTSPTSVSLFPGGTTNPIAVSVTPSGGFTGSVTVTATSSDPRITILPPTNPFTINVASAQPAQTSIQLTMAAQGQGQSQAQVTLTAVGGGHTHTTVITIINS